jgi:hypothetical protein
MDESSNNFILLISRVEELSKFVREINGRLSRIEGGIVLAGALFACSSFVLVLKYLFV